MEHGTLTREELMTYRDAKAENLKARWAIEKEKDRERIKTQLREALAIREAPTTRQAACRDRDLLDVFFSEAPGAIAQAKSICAECPIRESCLQGALERREPCGVWGGELFRNGPPASLLIQKAWQEAEELGLRDPDAIRQAALPIFIISGGHIRDFYEDEM